MYSLYLLYKNMEESNKDIKIKYNTNKNINNNKYINDHYTKNKNLKLFRGKKDNNILDFINNI